jgi:hypothetical protein
MIHKAYHAWFISRNDNILASGTFIFWIMWRIIYHLSTITWIVANECIAVDAEIFTKIRYRAT